MARVGGRNTALSWVAGVFCAAVVGMLFWFAIPILPMLAEMMGEIVRRNLV